MNSYFDRTTSNFILILLIAFYSIELFYGLNFISISQFSEDIAQTLYHSILISFIFVALSGKLSHHHIFASTILGWILYEYEIIDVYLFEYLYFSGMTMITNPLTIKLFMQFLVLSILLIRFFNNRHNVNYIIGIFVMGAILVTLTLYHVLISVNLTSIYQKQRLHEIENIVQMPINEYNAECKYQKISCYQFERLDALGSYINGSTMTVEESSYGFNLSFIMDMINGDMIIGYDPLFISNGTRKNILSGTSVRIGQGDTEYNEISVFFEEFDSIVVIYYFNDKYRIMYEVDEYTRNFKKFVGAFYIFSSFMMLIWYYSMLYLYDIHNNKQKRIKNENA